MLHVTTLLGHAGEARFEGRRVSELSIAWDEASRRRLRRRADDGTDVAIDLQRAEYLADGAVLADDGTRIVAVVRPPEPALVVRFDPRLLSLTLMVQALALGHAFGNQHIPIDVEDGAARIPLTTSEAIARATLAALDLDGVTVEIADVAVGRQRPLAVGHSHTATHGP